MLDRTTRTIILKNFLINQLFLYRKYKVLIRVYSGDANQFCVIISFKRRQLCCALTILKLLCKKQKGTYEIDGYISFIFNF